MGGNSDAGDSAFAAVAPAGASIPDSALASGSGGPSSMDGHSLDGGSSVLTSQRRSLTPMKRVESRVPVADVQEQPLLSHARKLLEDQRSK